MTLWHQEKGAPSSSNSTYSGSIYDLANIWSSISTSETALNLEFPAFNPFSVATPLSTAYFWQGGDENMGEAVWGGLRASRGRLEARITEC